MNLAIYCRVSSEGQVKLGVSLENQEIRGIDMAKKMGWEYKVYSDPGLSGTLFPDKRPGLDSMMTDIINQEVDAVYVTDLDRLSRDITLSDVIRSTMKENKVKLFDNEHEIDLDDVNQEFLNQLRDLLNAFELKKLSSRIKRDLKTNAKNGKIGGGLQPYGYKKGENNKMVIDDEEAIVIRKIYVMALDGLGTKVIANNLNDDGVLTKKSKSNLSKGLNKTFKWRDATIYGILTNKLYKGERKHGDDIFESPIIIKSQIFDDIQQELKQRKQNKDTTNKYFYLLKGKIQCGKCKKNFYGRKRENLRDNQYICSSQRYTGEFCGTRGINIDYLNKIVWEELVSMEEKIKSFFKHYRENDVWQKIKLDYVNLLNDEEKLKNSIEKSFELYESGNIDKKTIESRITKLNEEKGKVLLEQKDKEPMISIESKEKELLAFVHKHIGNLNPKLLSEKEQKMVINRLVDNIIIHWNSDCNKHTVLIDFKLDALTQVALGSSLKLRKMGPQSKIFEHKLYFRHLFSEEIFSESEGKMNMNVIKIKSY